MKGFAYDELSYFEEDLKKKGRLKMNLIERAICFATAAHRGQCRKGSQTPYVLHPLEAGAIVAALTDDEEIIAATILHDVLEDTALENDELEAEFGSRVCALVRAESEDKRLGEPAADSWKIRKQETIDALAREKDTGVKMIALADKLSNLRAMHSDYLKLGTGLWERFNQKDAREHAWYYRSVLELTRELEAFPAWKEYHYLLEAVFAGDTFAEQRTKIDD